MLLEFWIFDFERRNRFLQILPPHLKQNQNGLTPTMKRPPKMRTPDHTRLNLDQEKFYRPFIEGYIKIMQSNLKQVKHIGHNYSYKTYTCGEPHDRRNPNWKPFRMLWNYCERIDYDFSIARDIIFERPDVNWFVNVRCSGMIRSCAGGCS